MIRPRGSNAIQGLGNWQPIRILDRDYEISSVDAPAMEVFAFKYLDDDALCILGSGSFSASNLLADGIATLVFRLQRRKRP